MIEIFGRDVGKEFAHTRALVRFRVFSNSSCRIVLTFRTLACDMCNAKTVDWPWLSERPEKKSSGGEMRSPLFMSNDIVQSVSKGSKQYLCPSGLLMSTAHGGLQRLRSWLNSAMVVEVVD